MLAGLTIQTHIIQPNELLYLRNSLSVDASSAFAASADAARVAATAPSTFSVICAMVCSNAVSTASVCWSARTALGAIKTRVEVVPGAILVCAACTATRCGLTPSLGATHVCVDVV